MASKKFYESAELVFSVETADVYIRRHASSTGWTKTEWKCGDERSASDAYEKMEALGKAIKRALGQYEDGANSFDVRLVSEMRCEHCGSRWTEDSQDYNGGCCDADQAAEDARDEAYAAAAKAAKAPVTESAQ